MGRRVADGEEEHRVGKLSVQPDVLVEWEEPELWANPSHDGPAYREQDEHPIDGQDQAGSSGYPNRVLQGVQAC